MAIARIDKFIAELDGLTRLGEIKVLCDREMDYLRQQLKIETVYSNEGYPIGVIGDARRLKTQVSAYRSAINQLHRNFKNSTPVVRNGKKIRIHKALKYFNLAIHEKQDSNARDRQRVSLDKINRPSFNAVEVISKSYELLESKSYISKTAGLYLLTGRRHQEILVTGKFELPVLDGRSSLLDDWFKSDMDAALFSGQVKRKSLDDDGYNIPLLADIKIVQDAIEWLRINKPHQENERAKGSKELGEKVRKEFYDNGLLPTPAGKDNFLNPHSLRSAYSAICWQLYRNSNAVSNNCTEDIFIKAIMGHMEDSTQSAQSYLDYELNQKEITRLTNYYHF